MNRTMSLATSPSITVRDHVLIHPYHSTMRGCVFQSTTLTLVLAKFSNGTLLEAWLALIFIMVVVPSRSSMIRPSYCLCSLAHTILYEISAMYNSMTSSWNKWPTKITVVLHHGLDSWVKYVLLFFYKYHKANPDV